MKKILSLLLVFVGAFALMACGASDVPSVKESDKVTLNKTQLEEKMSGFSVDETKAFRSKGEVLISMEIQGFKQKSETTIDLYRNQTEVNGKIAMKSSIEDQSASIDAKIYYKDGLYFDLKTKGSESILGSLGSTTSGKFRVTEGSKNPLKDLLGLDSIEKYDFSDTIDLEGLKGLLDGNYSGLSFYENKNDFRIKLLINKSLLTSNKALLEKYLGNAFDDIAGSGFNELLKSLSRFDMEFVIVIKDNKLVEAGIKYVIEASISQMGLFSKSKVEMSFNQKFGQEMPSFPDFKDYEAI